MSQVKDQQSCRPICECLIVNPELMRDSLDQKKLHDDMQAEQSPEVAGAPATEEMRDIERTSEDPMTSPDVPMTSPDVPATETQLEAAAV